MSAIHPAAGTPWFGSGSVVSAAGLLLVFAAQSLPAQNPAARPDYQ